MIKLLGKASSINVRKVLWVLDELGLPYQREDYGSGFQSTHSPEFLALNPNAMVPVLLDGEAVLWESNTICRYLVNRYAESAAQRALLPLDPLARARVEQWMDWQATELNNAWRYTFMALVRQNPAHQDPQALADGMAAWHRHMALLDQQLQRTGAYAAGPDFTLADVVLGLSTQRWMMTPMERPTLPAVQSYFEKLSERPAFLAHGRNGLP